MWTMTLVVCAKAEKLVGQKKKNIMNFERRCTIKQKLSDGDYDPWQFLEAISHTIGKSYSYSTLTSSDSESSDNESAESPVEENKCIVCLGQRTTATWVFMPCRHACCCIRCSQRIKDLSQSCPMCRSDIESMIQIFIT